MARSVSASATALAALLLLPGCREPAEADLHELAARLLAATPDEQRAAVAADVEALARLARAGRWKDPERRALLDLLRSAGRDGRIDEDERLLLTRMVRDRIAATHDTGDRSG